MPASYPTSVKSFTTKNAGDTIQPAHINDLQDEVAAIETGLIGGASPLTSSNVSAAALTVSGGSTLATLQVTGNSTIAGTLTVNKIVSTSLIGGVVTSYVRAWAGSPAEYSTLSTGTKLALDQEVADLLGEYDNVTYTFTPQSSGYYLISARMAGNVSGRGPYHVGFWVNDSLAADYVGWGGSGEVEVSVTHSAVLALSSGAAGAVQLRAYSTGSTGRWSSGGAVTAMEIIKLF